MAQLDPLLLALLERDARELVLAAGHQPALRYGDELREVSPMSLTRGQITALLTELSDRVDLSASAAERSTGFVYSLGAGRDFRCEVVDQPGNFHARIYPDATVPGEQGDQPTAPERAGSAPPGDPGTAALAAGEGISTTGSPEIDVLLHQMVERGASDPHLAAEEVPMVRLHGDMARLPGLPRLTEERTRRLLEEIMSEHHRKVYSECNDVDLAYEIPGLARFRVNVFRDRKGTGGVLRVIPAKIMTVEELGLPSVLLRLCEMPKGLVLVTGPTGSGKSTTLATMIDHINRTRSDHIITIEDPIEFVHENRNCLVNQREVHTHTAGFKPALRAALREDPDIVLVGEMRDLETIAIAIETAETGHLVFGTLHTSTACSTVDRIIDQFPADRQSQIRMMLSDSLRGVVSQVLLKRIGGGRTAALEVLVVTPAISNLIREGKTFQIPSLMQTGKKHGMVLLNDALVGLVKNKQVEPDEAFSKAVDKTTFSSQLKSAGIRLTAPHDLEGPAVA